MLQIENQLPRFPGNALKVQVVGVGIHQYCPFSDSLFDDLLIWVSNSLIMTLILFNL